MRPLLYTLVYDKEIAAAFFAVFFALAAFWAKLSLPWGAAVSRALLASLSCGLLGGKKGEKPDLFVPGALASLTGALPFLVCLRKGTFEVPLSSYPIFLALGFLVSILLVLTWARGRRVDPAHVLDLAIVCLVAGPIGARAFFVVQFWDQYFADRPARLTIGDTAALGSSDELVVASGGQGVALVFSATDLESVCKSLKESGLRARLVTLDRRKRGSEIEHRVRGIVIESAERGDAAVLEASGAAAEKLGIAGAARGKTVPFQETLEIWNGGLVFYGGLVLAGVASCIYMKARGYRLLLVADLVAPVLALGLVFGRVGCFLNGCCWGREVDPGFSLAVHFPPGSHAWIQHARSVLPATWDALLDAGQWQVCPAPGELASGSRFVHPVQLYGVVLNSILFFLVLLYRRGLARREGQAFFLFLLVEPVFRFVAEEFRGDHDQFFSFLGWPLTVSQVVALATIPLGAAGFLWVTRRGPLLGEGAPEHPPRG